MGSAVLLQVRNLGEGVSEDVVGDRRELFPLIGGIGPIWTIRST
jgi:hypothetical protein